MRYTSAVQLLPVIYLGIHSLLIFPSRFTWLQRILILTLNLLVAGYFMGLILWSELFMNGDFPGLPSLFLWSPVVFFWLAYLWAGKTIRSVHPEDFTFDSALIQLEEKWFGQPSLWWAKGRSRSLNELMQFFYFSYFFYTLSLGLYLQLEERILEFQSMTFAVALGYLVAFTFFALTPATGPRWALVEIGLLPVSEQRQLGFFFTWVTEKIMYDGPAHKGGAMPSAHTSTAVVFIFWCWQIWGISAGIPALILGLGMMLGAVYGRYHYLSDVLAGILLGALSLLLASIVVF